MVLHDLAARFIPPSLSHTRIRMREAAGPSKRLGTFGMCLGMGREEMPEHHQKFARVILVTATERFVYVIAYHVAYLPGSHRIG